ncbi:hypothetical protein [Phenylobacterium sp.]|uniref:hypothetical protein n=1 Tax=Phenylobacterium sp. TaxID=1871053 RepID=UPI00272F7484|nr:hypothetical protein [Phenylobacterium sp.]MDP1617847.1 hypothetical protein [Phenylobacterium sp.]MDP1989107.1 hypothetical protein [Phenylobacterium sp.]
MTTLEMAAGEPGPWRTARGSRRFFLIMALAIAATVVFGFTLNASRFNFDVSTLPPLVHLHAGLFAAWIVFFVLQSALVVSGSVALHRRLGGLGAGLAVLMVITGIAVTIACVKRGATPPFFPPNVFLMVDILGVLCFFGLTAAAVALRRSPEWHRRLMLCGTIMVMSPAWGRILPMPLLGPWGGWAVFGAMMAYLLAGVVYDLVTRRRIHPAYFWGGGAMFLTQILIGPVAFSPPIMAWTASLLPS